MKSLILSCSVAAWALGCQAPTWDRSPEVDEGLLAHVSADGREQLEDERRSLADRREALAVEQRAARECESFVELAEEHLDVLEARVDEARSQIGHAREYGTTGEHGEAEQKRWDAEAAVQLAEAKLDYQEDLSELAIRRVALAEERVALAEARYELAKAEAIAALDRPSSKDIDVGDYREQVLERSYAVERARIEALVARERVALTNELVSRRTEGVPETLRLGSLEPADELFTEDLYDGEEDERWSKEASYRE